VDRARAPRPVSVRYERLQDSNRAMGLPVKIGADCRSITVPFWADGSSALPIRSCWRRAVRTLPGTVYKYFDFMFRPDFGLGQVVIYDAYLNYT